MGRVVERPAGGTRSTRRARGVRARDRGARLPRDRRRRHARASARSAAPRVRRAEALADEAPPRAVIFTGWSSTRRPERGRPDGRGVAGAARHRAAARAARESTPPRTRCARSSSCARSRAPPRSCSSARSGTSRACASSSTRPLPPLRLRARATATSCGRCPSLPLVAPRAVVDHAHGARPAPRAAPARRAPTGLSRPCPPAASDAVRLPAWWRTATTRWRWACCSIPAAARRRSHATSRARSSAHGWHVTLACGSLGAERRARQRGDVLRGHRHRARGATTTRSRAGSAATIRWTRRSRCTRPTRSARACPTARSRASRPSRARAWSRPGRG